MESFDGVEHSTEAYRQLACLLAARSIAQERQQPSSAEDSVATQHDTSKGGVGGNGRIPAAVEVAHYLLPQHPGFVPASSIISLHQSQQQSATATGAATADSSSQPLAISRRESYIPVCQECGGALEPGGCAGIAVRVHSTSRLSPSARRRASRRKAREMRRCNTRKNASKDDRAKRQDDSNLWRYIQDPQRRSFDCLANYLQITCGHCGGICRLAGQPNARPIHGSRRGKKQSDAKIKGPAAANGPIFLGDAQRQETTAGTKNTTTEDEDFLALGPTAGAVAPKPKRKKEAPKLGQPKKKKKKKPGDLLNFLSSLND